jgi:hypothetical protein
MAYDVKFRKRVIKYKDAGHTFKEVNEAFGVDSKRYYSWKKQLEQTGSLEYRSPIERRGKINKSELLRLLEERPDWYFRNHAVPLRVRGKIKCLPSGRTENVQEAWCYTKKLLLIRKSQRKTAKSS